MSDSDEGTPSPPRVGKQRRARHHESDEATARARVRNEFGRIKSIVLIVRSVFWASAAVSCVYLAIAFLVGNALRDEAPWVGHVLKLVFVSEIALSVLGAVWIVRSPLLWTAVGACLWTLNTGVTLWLTGFALGPSMLVRLFLLVSFWFAVGQAARVQRLLAADPSLQIVRPRLAPERRVIGGVADEAQERQRRERDRARAATARVIAVAGTAALVLGTGLWFLLRPPTVDASVARFAESWARGDVETIAGMFAGGASDRAPTSLRDDLERRGWPVAMPALGAPAVVANGTDATAAFALPDGELRTGWQRDGAAWQLTQVTLPVFAPPDLAPGIESFRVAWRANGADALVELFRPVSRERTGGSLRRMLDKRGWSERRPALGGVDPGRVSQGRARVVFALGRDDLTVAFEYWHPKWCVVGVSLPKE